MLASHSDKLEKYTHKLKQDPKNKIYIQKIMYYEKMLKYGGLDFKKYMTEGGTDEEKKIINDTKEKLNDNFIKNALEDNDKIYSGNGNNNSLIFKRAKYIIEKIKKYGSENPNSNIDKIQNALTEQNKINIRMLYYNEILTELNNNMTIMEGLLLGRKSIKDNTNLIALIRIANEQVDKDSNHDFITNEKNKGNIDSFISTLKTTRSQATVKSDEGNEGVEGDEDNDDNDDEKPLLKKIMENDNPTTWTNHTNTTVTNTIKIFDINYFDDYILFINFVNYMDAYDGHQFKYHIDVDSKNGIYIFETAYPTLYKLRLRQFYIQHKILIGMRLKDEKIDGNLFVKKNITNKEQYINPSMTILNTHFEVVVAMLAKNIKSIIPDDDRNDNFNQSLHRYKDISRYQHSSNHRMILYPIGNNILISEWPLDTVMKYMPKNILDNSIGLIIALGNIECRDSDNRPIVMPNYWCSQFAQDSTICNYMIYKIFDLSRGIIFTTKQIKSECNIAEVMKNERDNIESGKWNEIVSNLDKIKDNIYLNQYTDACFAPWYLSDKWNTIKNALIGTCDDKVYKFGDLKFSEKELKNEKLKLDDAMKGEINNLVNEINNVEKVTDMSVDLKNEYIKIRTKLLEFILANNIKQNDLIDSTTKIIRIINWKDFGVPSGKDQTKLYKNFEDIFMKMNQIISLDKSVQIHCKAGVGRTGTFILMYKLWKKNNNNELKSSNYESILYDEFIKLRCMRNSSVQTTDQFKFVVDYAKYLIIPTI